MPSVQGISDKNADLRFAIGADESKPTLVAIKGTVFDVTGNASYAAKGPYRGMTASPYNPSPEACPSVCDSLNNSAPVPSKVRCC